MAIQVVLSEKAKEDIARRILENSDFYMQNSNLRHLRAIVRAMLLEAIEDTVKIVNGIDPTVIVKVVREDD